MKVKWLSSVLFVILSISGCISKVIQENIDWEKPVSVYVLHDGDELQPGLMDGIEMKRILKDGLSRMKPVSTTYPNSTYKIRLVGKTLEGRSTESYVFGGYGWIGSGAGTARLADTQAFRLQRLIDETIANKTIHSTELRSFLAPLRE